MADRERAKPHGLSNYLDMLDPTTGGRGVEVLELSGGIDFDAGRKAAMQLLGLD